MKQNFFAPQGASILNLIDQIEYSNLETDAEKAEFAYNVGFKAGFKEAQNKYEPKVVFEEDENSGLL